MENNELVIIIVRSIAILFTFFVAVSLLTHRYLPDEKNRKKRLNRIYLISAVFSIMITIIINFIMFVYKNLN